MGAARVRVQVDVGFGDAITPATEDVVLPALLDHPPPRVKGYPRETAVAEKLQAMVALGLANSRMKDFYDVWYLARTFAFNGPTLSAAVRATFGRRETPVPPGTPPALTAGFASDPEKRGQWQAFLRKGEIDAPSLDEAVEGVGRFLLPVLYALRGDRAQEGRWQPGGPWSTSD